MIHKNTSDAVMGSRNKIPLSINVDKHRISFAACKIEKATDIRMDHLHMTRRSQYDPDNRIRTDFVGIVYKWYAAALRPHFCQYCIV